MVTERDQTDMLSVRRDAHRRLWSSRREPIGSSRSDGPSSLPGAVGRRSTIVGAGLKWHLDG
jgi:hypothetical protein